MTSTAALEIARSLADGELGNTFWRLDTERKSCLLAALVNNAHR